MKKNNPFLILLTCNLLFFTHTAFADTVSFTIDNDVFANKDGGYTNGTRIAWLGNELRNKDLNKSDDSYGSFMQATAEGLPFFSLDKQKNHNAGMSVYHMIVTPEDTSSSEPLYNDIPYSGSLLTSFFFFEWDKKDYHEYSFDIGLVGPLSRAEQIQKISHKIFPGNEPQGWDRI